MHMMSPIILIDVIYAIPTDKDIDRLVISNIFSGSTLSILLVGLSRWWLISSSPISMIPNTISVGARLTSRAT